jgi:hypothetical protein
MNPIGRCLKHRESAAAFRCRVCKDLGCVRCRARDETDLCDTCASYRAKVARIKAMGGIDVLLMKRRSRRRIRQLRRQLLVAVLVVFVLGLLLIYVVFPLRLVLRGSVFVNERRDGTGRDPMSVDSMSDRLRPDAAELQRRSTISRRAPPDRGEYEAGIPPSVTPAR